MAHIHKIENVLVRTIMIHCHIKIHEKSKFLIEAPVSYLLCQTLKLKKYLIDKSRFQARVSDVQQTNKLLIQNFFLLHFKKFKQTL